jgi:hypothetical protein
MAIVLKKTGLNAEGTKLYLQDQTIYADPNPIRELVSVFLFGFAKRTTGNVPVIIDSYVPEAAQNFIANLQYDGVHVFRMFMVINDSEVIGADGTITYRISDSTLLEVVNGVKVQIQESELWNKNLPMSELTTLVVTQSAKARNTMQKTLTERLQELVRGECDKGAYRKAQVNFNYVQALFKGAWFEYCTGNLMLATEKLESLLKYARK